jgi:DNA invertase Pin-like site-specific DNA recombinase
MKVAIYVRVSTEKQSYEQQIEPCINFCKMKGWDGYEIFKEIESSTKERPVFNDMMKRTRNGEFKFIIVWRFDRAWRSSRQFIMDFDNLQNLGIYVISVMEGLDPSTPMGKCMVTILVALAELERTNISLATKQRLDALHNLGVKLGRRPGSKDRHPRKKGGYYLRYANKRGSNKPG